MRLFVPALKSNTKGRASGGLAVLAKQYLPGLKPEKAVIGLSIGG